MTYFQYRSLIEHYEAMASKCYGLASLAFAVVGIIVVVGLLFITNPVIWLVMIIPIFSFICLGVIAMVNAQEATDMIETIKWRM